MKLSLRNLAMGAALAVSSLAFAQEMPFTVTENFNRGVTGADFGEGVILGNTLRCATGYNGVLYALDKNTGTVYSITGTEIKEFAKVDVNHGDNMDHVSTAITTDDAGNIIVGYANGDFFANAVNALAIIPAGGGDVIYTEPLVFPEDFTPGRSDVFGRIVGNVLSDEGAYFFVGGDGSGNKAACFYAVNGEFTAEEYASDNYKSALTSMNTVVPPFSTFDEVAECDPLYNAGVMTPWNASGPEIIVDAVGQGVGRPDTEANGIAYSAVPGADVFTYEGETYYVIPYTRVAGKRSGDFLIYDKDLNILFKTENTATDEFIAGGFLNGGGITVHPVEGAPNKFDLSFWGGPVSQVMAASYTITFPGDEPETPWTETGAFNIRPMFNRGVTGADFGDGVILGNTLRCATGYNGVLYALDKNTGIVYSVTGTEIKEFAKVDVNHGDNMDHVSTAITTDDAGNIIIGYANGDFFANAVNALAIIPAGGGDVIYTDPLEFPEGFTAGRSDIFGRIVGNVLSDEGAYFFVGGAGSGKKAACFYVVNGEFTAEEYASDDYASDLSSSNVVVPPFSTFDEVAECDPLYNAGVMTPWNAFGPEVIVDAVAKKVGRPEGLDYSAVPGADLFTYEGKTFYVIPYTRVAGKRSGDFVIYDEELNILFKSENTATDEFIAGGYLNGGGITVHPVEGTANKFILSFWGGPVSQVMAASYEIEFPGIVPPTPLYPEQLYVVGAMADWATPSTENAAAYENYILKATSDGVYNATVNVPLGKAQFRFFETLGGWDATQYGIAADDAPVDITFTDGTFNGALVAGKGSINVPTWLGGTMDITVSLVDKTVSIKANEEFVAGELYIRGEFNGWGTENKLDGPVEKDGKYVYTTTLATMPTGEFKIADNQWGADWGHAGEAPAFDNGIAYALKFKGENLNFPAAEAENVNVEFVLSADLSAELTFSWEVTAPASAFAYNMAMTEADGQFTLTYKASSTAEEAFLVLTNTNDPEKTFEVALPEPALGENTVAVEIPEEVEGGTYNWAVTLVSVNGDIEEPAYVLKKVGDTSVTWGRGGLVTITDPAYDSYGYTVVANSRGLGMDVYDQTNTLVGTFAAGAAVGTGNSAPLRGDQRFGKAAFAGWSDGNSGIWEFDPLNPENGCTQMAEGERSGNGTFTYNGVATVSSTPCVAFTGKGEETMMWTFDEDIVKNTILGYPVGNAATITVPASIICNTETCGWNSNGLLANTAVCFEPTEYGFFAAQNRADGMDSGTPAFVFVDNEGKFVNDSFTMMTDAQYTLPSCNGAVAISVDQKLLAVGSYDAIHFFEVTWADGEPVLAHLYDVAAPVTTKFSQAKFDAGNNLHIAGVNINNYNQQFYGVITLPGVSEAKTAAPVENVITIKAEGVENVAVDAADAEAVYYTVGGVRIAAEDLTPGVYVKVVGNTATKVVVK